MSLTQVATQLHTLYSMHTVPTSLYSTEDVTPTTQWSSDYPDYANQLPPKRIDLLYFVLFRINLLIVCSTLACASYQSSVHAGVNRIAFLQPHKK